jgi:hypothetical protein
MRFPLPADTTLEERLRLFEKYLEDKYQRTDAELEKHLHDGDRRAILKAERAEVSIIQGKFRTLFERELRQP